MTGRLFDIKEFALHDGNGLRITLFLQGCPLTCRWCHNPEGQPFAPFAARNEEKCRHCGLCIRPCDHPECAPYGVCLKRCPENLVRLFGWETTPEEAAGRVMEASAFFGQGGGVTFSGGEPTMQADFICRMAELLPGINKAIETCCCCPEEDFRRVMNCMDGIFADIKLMDERMHRMWTGNDNRLILRNLIWLKRQERSFTVRIPLIPGVTDTEANLAAAAEFLSDAGRYVRVELLPYNRLTGAKYRAIGKPYAPGFDEAQPLNKQTEIFLERGISCVAY